MQYAGIIYNDFSAAPGVCLSFFTQGCPHHCPGCHNQETWSFDGGREFTPKVLEDIIQGISANGITRNFCIMGGEPLAEENLFLTELVLSNVKKEYPNIKIYLWTGYYYNELLEHPTPHLNAVLKMVDVLIDGPYVEAERDITLPMRGSRNQSIINLKET